MGPSLLQHVSNPLFPPHSLEHSCGHTLHQPHGLTHLSSSQRWNQRGTLNWHDFTSWDCVLIHRSNMVCPNLNWMVKNVSDLWPAKFQCVCWAKLIGVGLFGTASMSNLIVVLERERIRDIEQKQERQISFLPIRTVIFGSDGWILALRNISCLQNLLIKSLVPT